MQDQLTEAAPAPNDASRPQALALAVRDATAGFFFAARHTLMVFGLLALGAVLVVFTNDDIRNHALAYFAPEQAVELPAEPPLVAALMPVAAAQAGQGASTHGVSNEEVLRQKQRVAKWISRRYRVANDATHMFVTTAYQTARELKLDPLLILSVIAIESRFNPFAESPAGAQGLMQVMSQVHKDKFEPLGGIEAALNPVANIKVGSRILKDYVTRGGSVEAGLKMYVGAALLETDSGYGAKVLAEYERLKSVAMGHKISVYATTAAAPKPTPKQQPAAAQETAQARSDEALAQAEQIASAM